MNKDKKVLYVVSCMTFVALLILLLLPVQNNKTANACVLILLTVATQLLVRKRTSYSISKREVLLVSIILSILYVALIELSGIKFGFYKNPYFANLNLILTTALPVAAIIVCSEIIRSWVNRPVNQAGRQAYPNAPRKALTIHVPTWKPPFPICRALLQALLASAHVPSFSAISNHIYFPCKPP